MAKEHTITDGGQDITYRITKSARAKRMRVAVYCGGAVVVTAPHTADESKIHRFVRTKVGWIMKKIGLVGNIQNPDLIATSRKHYLTHKKAALHLVREKVQYWNQSYGFEYNDIRIKDHKTKWGSCSGKKNLNFNYKILFLPEGLQDYIVVHELCHLREMNHSDGFWQLVAQTIPDYIERKKQFFEL